MASDLSMKELCMQAGSTNRPEAVAAQRMLAKSAEMVLREGIIDGDVVGNIFTVREFEAGRHYEWPLDFLTPGTERTHVAYTTAKWGDIPMRKVEGDFLSIPTSPVANQIDTDMNYVRDAGWDVIPRMLEVLEGGFTLKMNRDCYHILLAAANGRNLIVYDSTAADGFFSKRLLSLMITQMRRTGGGNSTSRNQHRLTDLITSPESLEDIRSWTLDDIDDVTRRQIFLADGGPNNEQALMRLYNVNLHQLDEFGVGQEYQEYYENVLQAGNASAMPSGKQELVLGLDLIHGRKAGFHLPQREAVSIYEDSTLHRKNLIGWYGRGEYGVGVSDLRDVMFGAV